MFVLLKFPYHRGTSEVFFTDEHTIISNGEAIFVYRMPVAFVAQVCERLDTIIAVVYIVSHGIMGRSQQEFADTGFREKLQYGDKKLWESCLEAGSKSGNMGRSFSELEAVSM